jgi:hypothetical protein
LERLGVRPFLDVRDTFKARMDVIRRVPQSTTLVWEDVAFICMR